MASLLSFFIVSASILAFFCWSSYTEHKRLKRKYDAFLRFCYEYKNKKPSPLGKGFLNVPNELDELEGKFIEWLYEKKYIDEKHGLDDFGFYLNVPKD